MLGKRLIKLRKGKKLTQQDMADKLNISRSAYAGYEIDRRVPEYNTLENMANLFGVSIDYLVGRTDDPNLVMSDEARSFVEKLELTDEEFIKNNTITIDGIPLTEDQIKKFRDYVRFERAGKMGN
jgi:transcriptional regulator with XRE-family HTH domain